MKDCCIKAVEEYKQKVNKVEGERVTSFNNLAVWLLGVSFALSLVFETIHPTPFSLAVTFFCWFFILRDIYRWASARKAKSSSGK